MPLFKRCVLSKSFLPALILTSLLSFLCSPGLVFSEKVSPKKESALEARVLALVPKAIRPSTGIAVLDLNSGSQLFALNAEHPFKPASVLKILASIVALQELGPEYRFKTRFFVDEFKDATVHRLYVKGGADPGLKTENLLYIARELKKRGIKKIEQIVLDNSAFVEISEPQGQRAYQTGASALAFNYNSYGFRICPSAQGKDASVSIDPWEVGLKLSGSVQTTAASSGMVKIDAQEGSTAFRLGGTIGVMEPCAVIFRSSFQPEMTLGILLREFLEDSGVKVERSAQMGLVPEEAIPFYEFESDTLKRTIEDLNHYSNNFIAEQLLYVLGEGVDGRMSRQAGLRRLSGYLNHLGFPEDEYNLSDASGLSHENRISPRILTRLLKQAYSDIDIGPEFVNSLSVAEQSGTLRKRSFSLDSAVVRAKTGTIDGVSSLAGYIFTRSGKKYAFSILQNSVNSKEDAVKIENEIAALIANL